MAEDAGHLADIRRSVEVGLTGVNGRLDVIIERLDHHGRRVDQHEEQLTQLDTRLDAVERTAVTREDMDSRGRRTISIVALVVSAIGIVVGTLTTVIITLTT